VWIGTLLTLGGSFLAIARRWRDVSLIAQSATEGEG
jgi:hypothetical protein